MAFIGIYLQTWREVWSSRECWFHAHAPHDVGEPNLTECRWLVKRVCEADEHRRIFKVSEMRRLTLIVCVLNVDEFTRVPPPHPDFG